MKRATFLLISVLATISCNIQAETRLAVGGWSHHYLYKDTITNEVHKIVGVEHKGWSAGYFANSYGRDTFFVAKNWRWAVSEDIAVSASLGLNRGYRECYGDNGSSGVVCPHGYLGISYERYRVVPSIKMQPGVIIFSPEIKF